MIDKGARLGSRVRNILDDEQKLKMRKLWAMGIRRDDLATRFGINRSLVDKTLNKMSKRERENR